MFKRIGIKLILFILLTLLTTIVVSANLTFTNNSSGELGDFNFEFWRESRGEGSMTVFRNGTFQCTWENADVILFRTGKKFEKPGPGRTREIFLHENLGDIFVSYAADFEPDGNSYLCVYGWSLEPLVEYYVIEGWGSWHPTGDDLMGTITVDGGTYDVYVTMRIEEASINGTQTFPQFWSVRTDMRTEGTISLSEHFKAWESMGMELGNLFEVAFCVEGIDSSGEANVYEHLLTIGSNTYGEGTHVFVEHGAPGISPLTIAFIAIGVTAAAAVVFIIILITLMRKKKRAG